MDQKHKIELTKLKIELLILTGLGILLIEIFYYFRGVPFWDNVFDWFIGMTIALILISYAISKTSKILAKETYLKYNLEQKRNDLEKEVKNQTKELEEARKGLEKMVSERTKELKKTVGALQNKNQQLKLIEKMVTDRELKMIELKKEIEKIKNKN